MARDFEKLISLAELAAILGWERRRAWRHIRALYASKPAPWLVRNDKPGMVRPRYRINISLLRNSHPELFEASDPDDFKALVDNLRMRVAVLEQRDHAKGAAIRDLRNEWKLIQSTYKQLADRVEAEMLKMVEAYTVWKDHRAHVKSHWR